MKLAPIEQLLTTGTTVSVEELVRLRAYVGEAARGSRQALRTSQAGPHLSRFRGRGMDFDEVRAYQPGDDVRYIDWRVTARTGKPHTKLFAEERERPVFLVIDQGDSMRFGTRVAFKSAIAARLGALLAWHAAKHGDRIGALLFADNRHTELRPLGGQRGALQLIRALATSQHIATSNATSALSHALARLSRTAKPGSLAYLISDFRHFDDSAERDLARLARHIDVVMILVYDPLEMHAPPPGHYRISDGQEVVSLFVQAHQPPSHIEQFTAHRQHLQKWANAHAIAFSAIATDEAVVDILRAGLFLRRRYR